MLAELNIFGLAPAAWLAILGALFEIAGFMLVAVELVRAQRRELGTAGPFEFLVRFGRSISRLLRKPEDVVIRAPAADALAASDRVSVRIGNQSPDLEVRVHVLEENFKQLNDEVTGHRTELEDRISREAERHHGALADFRAEVEAKVDEDRAAFAKSAVLQWLGIALFVIGAVFSAAANVVGA